MKRWLLYNCYLNTSNTWFHLLAMYSTNQLQAIGRRFDGRFPSYLTVEFKRISTQPIYKMRSTHSSKREDGRRQIGGTQRQANSLTAIMNLRAGMRSGRLGKLDSTYGRFGVKEDLSWISFMDPLSTV